MTAIIIVLAIIFLIAIFSGKKKKKASTESTRSKKDEAKQQNILHRSIPVITTFIENNEIQSDNNLSAIPESTPTDYDLKKHPLYTPEWSSPKVRSLKEINVANAERQAFYKIFKGRFLIGEYLNIGLNLNYALILIFDLIAEYEVHKDFYILDSYLEYILKNYPSTTSVVETNLARIKGDIKNWENGLTSEYADLMRKVHKKDAIPQVSPDLFKSDSQAHINIASAEYLERFKPGPDNTDKTIIDVTGQTFQLDPSLPLKKYDSIVPLWDHQYIYDHSQLNGATPRQRKFYEDFKRSFLASVFIDLEGNNNYAFILLFELLHEYTTHRDLEKLKGQLTPLGNWYPKTKVYVDSNIQQRMSVASIFINTQDSNFTNTYIQTEDNTTYENYWKLGHNYKKVLNLNEDEVTLLNRLWSPSNNFCDIEYCRIQILRLFIGTVSSMKDKYIQEGTTIDKQFLSVAEAVSGKALRYKVGSDNYKYYVEPTVNEFYSHIFKHCENAVRESYGHKRKISTDLYYPAETAKQAFNSKILTKVRELLPVLASGIQPPDEATEIQLYTQNTNRWKIKFDTLTDNLKYKPAEFMKAIVELGKLNQKNPSLENIFFEASKFIARYDKEVALLLYVHYLFHDLNSVTFDNRQLTKTIQKSLFNTAGQLHDFEQILTNLIKDKNLEKALQAVPKIYEVKRKKIKLDIDSINEVQQLHSGTVELLNQYLDDGDDEPGVGPDPAQEKGVELNLGFISEAEPKEGTIYSGVIIFTPTHISVLEKFAKNNFSVLQSEFETFAKSMGLFRNNLVESINELCYETLDDLLIEEEDEFYTINTDYYNQILAK